jgi:hypothetical protein
VNLSTAPSSASAAPVPLLAELERALQHVVTMRVADLRTAAADRTSVESRWLQGDLYRELSARSGLNVASRVGVAAKGEQRLIDLVLTRSGERLLVALKTFLTNYGRPGKNVTQSRDAILADVAMLARRVDDQASGALVWLAYPIPTEREGDWRINHLRLIAKRADTRLLAKINVGQAYVHVYLSQPQPGAALL